VHYYQVEQRHNKGYYDALIWISKVHEHECRTSLRLGTRLANNTLIAAKQACLDDLDCT
jgi:hypothetical protein